MEFIMPQTEITIQEHKTQDYNDPNKEAKTNFKVTAEDGTRYSYPKNRTDWKLSDIGATRLIIWEEKEPVNAHGKPWKLIQDVILQPDDDIPYGNGANGSAQPSYQPSQPQTNHQSTTLHQSDKDKIITRLAIAKSCIESNKTIEDANKWLNWVYDDYRG